MDIHQTVLEAKRYGVYGCNENKSLGEAAQQMVDEDISSLVVVDEDGFLTGIITRTDLLRAVTVSPEWKKGHIKDFMNPSVVTVSAQTTLLEVARLLQEHQIHRIVVVRQEDGKPRPLSVVSDADVLYHMVNS